MFAGRLVIVAAVIAAGQEQGRSSSEYELLARLAEGGMAEIFLARARSAAGGMERHVVLKRIRRERGEDPLWVKMFLDEARLAALLQHPNVAQVYDLGQIGDSYFFTMEYVHGENVRDVLARMNALDRRVPVNVALAIACGAAAGLGHAHDRCGPDGAPLGIVHRDVSPSNLIVGYEGTVKVVDFGVAKAARRTTESVATASGTIMGKLAYLSPEQCLGSAIDHRSDIFSLGIVLYELLTSLRVFRIGDDLETISAVVHHEPPPPSHLAAAIPADLDEVVMTALEKDPARRFASCADMLEALEAIAEREKLSMSQTTVRRFMRDLFGHRPEPWRELAALSPRSVTMTLTTGQLDLEPPTQTQKGTPAPEADEDYTEVSDAATKLSDPGDTVAWFPADTIAAEVPLLAAMRTQLIARPPTPSPNAFPLRGVPPPLVAAGSIPGTPGPTPGPTPAPTVIVGAQSIDRTLPILAWLTAEKRRLVVIGLAAVATIALAIALYIGLSGDDLPRRAAPAATPEPVTLPPAPQPSPPPAAVADPAPVAAPPIAPPASPATTAPAGTKPLEKRSRKTKATPCTDPLKCQH
jgi:serine/threonine-protein kinase